ncbi:MAG: aminodeoxychorismate/anthranilate synthase component II [Chloroflexi bacterium]|nr:aminodeoxychorismate/anthranilate synthase component II [Chloroflexota bacterium]
MILVIDNYDSLVYNLVQYLGELGREPRVFRNDALTLAQVETLRPSHIVISPGPCTPREAGISNDVITRFKGRIPILGVCLGHQCIGHVYGGVVRRAAVPVHGKPSLIFHDGRTLFRGLPSPFTGGRYHSLVVDEATLPAALEVSARTAEGEIMGVRSRTEPVEGIQVHPESILTEHGHQLLANFLGMECHIPSPLTGEGEDEGVNPLGSTPLP